MVNKKEQMKQLLLKMLMPFVFVLNDDDEVVFLMFDYLMLMYVDYYLMKLMLILLMFHLQLNLYLMIDVYLMMMMMIFLYNNNITIDLYLMLVEQNEI